MNAPVVGVIMGSKSDWETPRHAAETLSHECRIVSAHRTPEEMAEYASTAATRGLEVIIAGAGGAAHLPAMVAAHSILRVRVDACRHYQCGRNSGHPTEPVDCVIRRSHADTDRRGSVHGCRVLDQHESIRNLAVGGWIQLVAIEANRAFVYQGAFEWSEMHEQASPYHLGQVGRR